MDSLTTFVKFGPKLTPLLAEFNQICFGQTLVFELRGFYPNSDFVELTALIGFFGPTVTPRELINL
jgi:hypothetical protein